MDMDPNGVAWDALGDIGVSGIPDGRCCCNDYQAQGQQSERRADRADPEEGSELIARMLKEQVDGAAPTHGKIVRGVV